LSKEALSEANTYRGDHFLLECVHDDEPAVILHSKTVELQSLDGYAAAALDRVDEQTGLDAGAIECERG